MIQVTENWQNTWKATPWLFVFLIVTKKCYLLKDAMEKIKCCSRSRIKYLHDFSTRISRFWVRQFLSMWIQAGHHKDIVFWNTFGRAWMAASCHTTAEKQQQALIHTQIWFYQGFLFKTSPLIIWVFSWASWFKLSGICYSAKECYLHNKINLYGSHWRIHL